MAARNWAQACTLVLALIAVMHVTAAQGSRQAQHTIAPSHQGQHHPTNRPSWGRQLLSALSTTAANAAAAANIWPPRETTPCTGAYCASGAGWNNYGYTQAVPAGGWGGNPNFTPDGYMRPVPLARPMLAGAGGGRRRR